MDQKPLRIFNVNEILAGLPLADLSRGVEQEDDADAFPMQAAFGSGGLFIGGFVGLAPWENHPDTDELLYAVEGEVEITILTDAGAQTEMLRQGCVCIVPKGLWHRQHAHAPVRLMTISGPSLSSRGDDPRPLTRRGLWRQHEPQGHCRDNAAAEAEGMRVAGAAFIVVLSTVPSAPTHSPTGEQFLFVAHARGIVGHAQR